MLLLWDEATKAQHHWGCELDAAGDLQKSWSVWNFDE